MIVKSQIKLIKSLHQKKYRNEKGLFFVEGLKTVNELLDSNFEVYHLYVTEHGLVDFEGKNQTLLSDGDLKKISALKTPNKVLGVFKIPQVQKIDYTDWIVALDDVRDPGNLGTIIRLCDWFGIRHLVCSLKTVDCYNPKTLQATMGSISRVNIGYTDLPNFLASAKVPIYGAFMNGHKVYGEKLPNSAILVMGNEAHGISGKVASYVTKKISIPQPTVKYDSFRTSSTESLNVATATAILLSEVRREETSG